MMYCTAIHPMSNDQKLGISLNIFVLPSAMLRTGFVFFVGQLIFRSLLINRSRRCMAIAILAIEIV